MTVSSAAGNSSSSSSSPSASQIASQAASSSLGGIDWNALIQAEVAAKLQPATNIQTKITSNQTKISAYQQMQTMLSSLAKAADSFSGSNTGTLSDSIFSARAANLTYTGTTDAQSILGMTLNNGAPVGNYTLTIQQLAEAQKVAGTDIADQTTALGYSGTFSIGLAGGTSANIKITADMSLQQVVAQINSQTGTTNVQASVVQVSANQFKLVLAGTQDGVAITTNSVSGDDVLTNLGVTDGSGNFTHELQKAQMAEFTFDGIQLTRDTNDISDVIDGATFHLLQTTGLDASNKPQTLDIDIGTDTDQITTALQSFVTAYNAYRDYVASQQATGPDGTAAAGTVLFGDPTMNDIMTQLQNAMNSSVNGLSLSDLGLSFSDSNDLQLNTSTLDSILSSNLQGVQALLSSQATTSTPDLNTISVGSAPPGSFTLDLQVDSSGNLVSASVNGDSTMFTAGGGVILGNPGTPYAGMAFDYSGSTSQSITVTVGAGLASQISAIGKDNSDPLDGSLQVLVTNLQEQDGTMSQKITDIQSEAATFQARLQAQYANYQSTIQKANTTLNYLKALLEAQSASNN
jgi:flagellar hook-associated protein 2